VWSSSILDRDFRPIKDYQRGLYYAYLSNAVGFTDHVLQVIGYYAHEYKDETMGYICTMTEECANPEEGGGAGKNVFANLLRETTTLKSMPGSQTDWSDKLLSSWDGEKIFSISDAPRDTDFAFLKDLSTGEGSWKKLYKDPVSLPCSMMPKFLVSTNFSVAITDGGLRRRIIPIEFTDYYTIHGGVDKAHGDTHFPKGWNEEEYLLFDNIILAAIQAFLKTGCKLTPPAMTRTGWEKQFKQIHGEITWNFIQEYWDSWVRQRFVRPDDFNATYETYCNENGVGKNYRKNTINMNKALAEYAKHNKVDFTASKDARIPGALNNNKAKYKEFIDISFM
jgi:hypothetical protein